MVIGSAVPQSGTDIRHIDCHMTAVTLSLVGNEVYLPHAQHVDKVLLCHVVLFVNVTLKGCEYIPLVE